MEKKLLLADARESVKSKLAGSSAGVRTKQQLEELYRRYPILRERRGAFVTLKTSRPDSTVNSLRGCIGSLIGSSRLYEEVMRLAVEAAFHDPRFPPVSQDEWEGLLFEISVLTPMQAVSSYRDIRIGRDGILLNCNGRHAVFLPQVAVEQGWDLETTLTHLALKAGLPPEAWKNDSCSFEVFQAEVFSEEDYRGSAV
ncbi:MAG: AmmeMemoRadiSam system protein A [Spirochaetota bacterium]